MENPNGPEVTQYLHYLESWLSSVEGTLDQSNNDLLFLKERIKYIADAIMLQQRYAGEKSRMTVVESNRLIEDSLAPFEKDLSMLSIQLTKELAQNLPPFASSGPCWNRYLPC